MTVKQRIKRFVEKDDTTAGKVFDYTIQVLIIFSLITFSVETLPDLSPWAQDLLRAVEAVTVVIFTAEYLLRLWVADRKLGFVFSFYGIIDFLAILPFYVTTGLDLRSLRVFRLFRLFRLLKLLRYARAVERFKLAFASVRYELALFLAACALLIYVASVGIYYFERAVQPESFGSVFACMWWAVATLTTVGYGDVYPVTAGGRIFTTIILFIGLGIIAVPTGLVASALSDVLSKERTLEEEGDVPPSG